jgi:xanthine dehydrogenase YagT iron-sulfur-binding subunit
MDDNSSTKLTRRGFMIAGAGTAAAIATPLPGAATPEASGAAQVSSVSFLVNGQKRELTLDPRTTLLDALREHLQLTGTKKGCDHGQCGACTVIAGGQRVLSCLSLAIMQEGRSVTTIEGLGSPVKMHPMQRAFVKHDGYQCGYCTPGRICSAVGMLQEIRAGVPSHVTADLNAPPQAGATEFRERMSGNLCRCGAYSHHRRQPAAAYPLPVFLRPEPALQQTRAGQRLRRAPGLQPPARDHRP